MIGHGGDERNLKEQVLEVDLGLLLLEEEDLGEVFALEIQGHGALGADHVIGHLEVFNLKALLAEARTGLETSDKTFLRATTTGSAVTNIEYFPLRMDFAIDDHDKHGARLSCSRHNVPRLVHIEAKALDKQLKAGLVDLVKALKLIAHV